MAFLTILEDSYSRRPGRPRRSARRIHGLILSRMDFKRIEREKVKQAKNSLSQLNALRFEQDVENVLSNQQMVRAFLKKFDLPQAWDERLKKYLEREAKERVHSGWRLLDAAMNRTSTR